MGPTVGWNSLLIELFWPKLCSNGSKKGWIRLCPAGLNWHFGAETDLFNLQCDYLISMDFLIQTAWYSIELHGHALAFHGTPSVLQRTPWHSMELYDIPWNSMDLQGNSMEFHGIPWNSINTSWNSVELHGIPWNSMDTPRNSMAFHGTPWILHGTPRHSIELVPWNSIDFHRFPWIPFHGGISHGDWLQIVRWCQSL